MKERPRLALSGQGWYGSSLSGSTEWCWEKIVYTQKSQPALLSLWSSGLPPGPFSFQAVSWFPIHWLQMLMVLHYILPAFWMLLGCLSMSFLASSRASVWWVMQCQPYSLQITGQCPTVSATAIAAVYSHLMYWKLPKLSAWKQENLWPVYIVVMYNSLPIRTETTQSGLNKTGIC